MVNDPSICWVRMVEQPDGTVVQSWVSESWLDRLEEARENCLCCKRVSCTCNWRAVVQARRDPLRDRPAQWWDRD
jgi:hypothetical protein